MLPDHGGTATGAALWERQKTNNPFWARPSPKHEWRLNCLLGTPSERMHTERLFKILIIEDDPVDREVYKRCLQQSSNLRFEFAEAGGAVKGVELSKSWRPDCTLLDFNLPDGNGFEVLAKLRDEAG